MGLKELVLLIGLSLIQTDWYQSIPVLRYTDENPLVTPNGMLLTEGNEFVSGSPEMAKDMTDFMMQAHEVAPVWLGVALSVHRALTVISNDRILAKAAMPRCYMISYRWRF